MEYLEYPLIREYHPEYEDIYVWHGLPGGFHRYEMYGFLVILAVVFIAQFLNDITTFAAYAGALFVLLILAGVYKGFQVGINSIGYTRYESPYITRCAENFIIWGEDPPIAIDPGMKIRILEVNPNGTGLVQLVAGEIVRNCFLAKTDFLLQQFAEIIAQKYELLIEGENGIR